jgi:hypothetical protein
MALFEQLMKVKGSVSNAFSKKVAEEILSGNTNLLKEAVPLVIYNSGSKKEKHVRIAAAGILDCVAKEKPALVAPYLEKIFPALDVDEPQTRWIVIRTIGYCSLIKPDIAKKAVQCAKKYIFQKKEGQLCLLAAADQFLGEYGSHSKENANEVYPILLESTNTVLLNEHDWLMESFLKITEYLNAKQKRMVLEFVDEYKDHPRKTTQLRIKKLTEQCR